MQSGCHGAPCFASKLLKVGSECVCIVDHCAQPMHCLTCTLCDHQYGTYTYHVKLVQGENSAHKNLIEQNSTPVPVHVARARGAGSEIKACLSKVYIAV